MNSVTKKDKNIHFTHVKNKYLGYINYFYKYYFFYFWVRHHRQYNILRSLYRSPLFKNISQLKERDRQPLLTVTPGSHLITSTKQNSQELILRSTCDRKEVNGLKMQLKWSKWGTGFPAQCCCIHGLFTQSLCWVFLPPCFVFAVGFSAFTRTGECE